MGNKAAIKKAFGFLIIVIAIGMVGIEFVLSIFNSYGAQMERTVNEFKKTRIVYNKGDAELPLYKKVAQMDAQGVVTAQSMLYRIIRRKEETATGSQQQSSQPATQQGTSGGGGQQDPAAGDPTMSGGGDPTLGGQDGGDGGAEATAPVTSGVSESLKTSLTNSFKSKYSPNNDDLNNFKNILNSLSSDEHAKMLSTIIKNDTPIENVLRLDDAFFKGMKTLFTGLTENQKKIFIDVVGDEYTEYKAAGMQRLTQVVEFFKTEEAKKIGLKMDDDTFKTYALLFGQEVDNITASIKYLVEKRIKDYKKMRFLSKPIYQIVSWLITIVYILACIGFLLTMETSRILIMFFGIIKVFFLLTIPIIFLGFITGAVVLLSILAIALSMISMYIVDLRLKKKTA